MEQSDQVRKRARLEDPTAPAEIEQRYQEDGDAIMFGDDRPVLQHDVLASREKKTGITSFVSPSTGGFSGILKMRYTDFIVNEISQSGKVLHLYSLDLPSKSQKPAEPVLVEIQPASNHSSNNDSKAPDSPQNGETGTTDTLPVGTSQISEEEKVSIREIFGEKCLQQILKLDAKVQANPTKKARDFSTFNSEPIEEKPRRTTGHQLIRRVFESRLQTTTEDDNTIKFIASPPSKKASNWSQNTASGRSKGKLGWEQLGGEHVHFTLYKENKDTMEVVHYLCTQFKVQPRSFAFAGTKDRRAVTVQRFSAYRVQAERLAGMNKSLRNARLGDFKYEQSGLELGQLLGNEFVITLRDCQVLDKDQSSVDDRKAAVEKHIKAAALQLSERGFINYYGLQRFGTFDVSTDAIGALLLQGNYEGAIDKLLEYTPVALASFNGEDTPVLISSDESNRAGAISTWRRTGKASEALAILPRKYSAESNIIRHLSRSERKPGKDWQGALASIQRNLRLMYVHAYQSLVWNVAASKRWELFGDQVVEGDLVISGNDTEEAEQVELDEQGELIVRPGEHDSAKKVEDAFERARPLTAAEVDSGKFSIYDIVLPQPGYDVEYPRNAVGEFYKEFMSSERGGKLDPYNMRRDWKDLSLSGAYRPLLARSIGDIEVQVKEYQHDTEQLVTTDLEKLIKDGKVNEKLRINVESKQNDNDGRTVKEAAETKIAVVIKLQLGSSQYATMALREMTKGGVVNYKPEYGTR